VVLFRLLVGGAGGENRGAELIRSADVRYAGQSYELNVPWKASEPGRPFHAEHQRVYGYSDKARPIEVVTVRVRARRSAPKVKLDRAGNRGEGSGARARRRVWVAGRWREIAVYGREQVGAGRRSGPALVIDYGSTTLIPPGWGFRLDRYGTLVVQRGSVRSGG